MVPRNVRRHAFGHKAVQRPALCRQRAHLGGGHGKHGRFGKQHRAALGRKPGRVFPHRSRVLARAQVRHKNDAAQQLPVRRPVAEPEQHIAAHGKIKLCAGIPHVHLPHGINGIAFAAARDLRGIQHQLRK